MENSVGCISPFWVNQFRSIQIILIPTPAKMVTEFAKALPKNGFIFIVDKNKICRKETQSSYLTSSAGRTSTTTETTTLSVSGFTHTRGGTSL